mmetsp:Transcript_4355/g.11392  ORF Transcript_4355/g.11392 Transcript_4355/m.11392 type:complete len:314 (-) Transcript_4355:2008-2949(-)
MRRCSPARYASSSTRGRRRICAWRISCGSQPRGRRMLPCSSPARTRPCKRRMGGCARFHSSRRGRHSQRPAVSPRASPGSTISTRPRSQPSSLSPPNHQRSCEPSARQRRRRWRRRRRQRQHDARQWTLPPPPPPHRRPPTKPLRPRCPASFTTPPPQGMHRRSPVYCLRLAMTRRWGTFGTASRWRTTWRRARRCATPSAAPWPPNPSAGTGRPRTCRRRSQTRRSRRRRRRRRRRRERRRRRRRRLARRGARPRMLHRRTPWPGCASLWRGRRWTRCRPRSTKFSASSVKSRGGTAARPTRSQPHGNAFLS